MQYGDCTVLFLVEVLNKYKKYYDSCKTESIIRSDRIDKELSKARHIVNPASTSHRLSPRSHDQLYQINWKSCIKITFKNGQKDGRHEAQYHCEGSARGAY